MSYLAEQNVIGSILLDFDSISKINFLSADMFHDVLFSKVFAELKKGYVSHKVIDLTILMQKLENTEFAQDVTLKMLTDAVQSIDSSAFIEQHAKVILDDYKAQQANKILDSLVIKADGIDDQISSIINSFDELRTQEDNNISSLSDIADEYKDSYFNENNNSEDLTLGFDCIDDMLGGLENGDIMVIGARPSVGKSAFVTQVASYIYNHHDKRVGFFNLEMSNKQMYERFIVNLSGIPLNRIRKAVCFLNDEKERFDAANEELKNMDKLFISTGSKSVEQIRTIQKSFKFDVIIIDYLQLIKPSKAYRGSRVAEVGDISRSLKALALEMGIPIILLSQLNRSSEHTDTKEPTMAELRESGDIEQDASIICLMWNKDANDKSKKGFKIDKNRQGITGKQDLTFDGSRMKFIEYYDDSNNPFV